MKVGKPKSKRGTVRLRHKIEKASVSKQRKQRKEAKKNPQWRSRLKKDPGIPNLFPYKAKILAEIEESKRRREEEQMRKREVAKARREGKAVNDAPAVEEADDLIDEDEEEEEGGVSLPEDDVEMDVDQSNPMAALLASAQARAQTYGNNDGGGDVEEDSEEEEDDEEDEEWEGMEDTKIVQKKALPKRALQDPIKAATLLMAKMQETDTGTQLLLDQYQIPALVTGGTDFTTRFLVEVARKRGRLGRGGIPNLHAAALIVLTDIHEQRIQLPSAPTKDVEKGEVTIVRTMAAPFKLEGLWGDDEHTAMAVDA